MKKFNLIISLFFLFGFFQLILVYKNFQLMNKITHLEDEKKLLMVKIKKEDIYLDSLSTLFYSFVIKESLEIEPISGFFPKKDKDSFNLLFLTPVANKENGEE
ncbi:MAG: hypothetical protein N2323_02055 [candidate division WOR-3 bacterium]|nr:hypothetical protein [candidate division WOR-3 bacterium]MCX7836731.1 hypothetical protein [candidate division WOR-3 bacterium]MDW8113366.1 hypothetical protein [candidate division WOR-3 bacterium]